MRLFLLAVFYSLAFVIIIAFLVNGYAKIHYFRYIRSDPDLRSNENNSGYISYESLVWGIVYVLIGIVGICALIWLRVPK